VSPRRSTKRRDCASQFVRGRTGSPRTGPVLSVFTEMYQKDKREFPSRVSKADHLKRLCDVYPNSLGVNHQAVRRLVYSGAFSADARRAALDGSDHLHAVDARRPIATHHARNTAPQRQ
jgi:hypothetical protein